MRAKNFLITGRPGVGKTTLIKRVVGRLPFKCGGFYTEEVREGGQRVGFRIVTLDGREGILAWKGLRSPHKVGKYGVKVDDLERVGVDALRRALKEAEVVVVDEIAKMELFCPSFAPTVRECLDSPKPLLATLQDKPLPFLQEIRSRPDVEILKLTVENREGMVDEVIRLLYQALTGEARQA